MCAVAGIEKRIPQLLSSEISHPTDSHETVIWKIYKPLRPYLKGDMTRSPTVQVEYNVVK